MSVARHTPEQDLLVCCACARLDPETAHRIQTLVAGGMDWPALAAAAERHGILALAFKHLQAVCPGSVPADALEFLRSRAREQAWRNLGLAEELLSVLDLFAARQVLAIPFKGPALASFAYGDLSLRQFCDLDILIRPRDIEKAYALLVARQYRCDVVRTAEEIVTLAGYASELVFHRGDVTIELHWRSAPDHFSLALDFDDLFDRRTIGWIGKREIAALSNEDLLLALCVHGTKDAWQRLVWLADIAEVMRERTIDWKLLLGRARGIGANRLLLGALLAARDFLGCTLPPLVSDSFASDPGVGRLAKRIQASVCGSREGRSGGVAEARFHLAARERAADRLRYCWRVLLTPTIEDRRFAGRAARVPGFAHVVRPVRLLAKYGGAS